HSVRDRVSTYQKSSFLIGHPSDGSAVQDDGLRMSFLALVACSVTRTQSCQADHQLSQRGLDCHSYDVPIVLFLLGKSSVRHSILL
ncbi:hypothetical protein DFH11DRAFT_1520338, partial [Phellopilus nigrolimitatus]